MSNSGARGKMKIFTGGKVLATLAIFMAGALTLGGVNTFFAYTNQMEFCTSCHSMQTNLAEYKETPHYKNRSGVRAICSDCHVPKDFGPKVALKVMAVRDIYHELVGTVDTKEKYEAQRWVLANRVWDRMKATDSRECRSCHNYDNMDFEVQASLAQKKHPKAQASGKTCIDCHKGVAHHEPMPPEEAAAKAAEAAATAAPAAQSEPVAADKQVPAKSP